MGLSTDVAPGPASALAASGGTGEPAPAPKRTCRFLGESASECGAPRLREVRSNCGGVGSCRQQTDTALHRSAWRTTAQGRVGAGADSKVDRGEDGTSHRGHHSA